jgi:hypothetical protein
MVGVLTPEAVGIVVVTQDTYNKLKCCLKNPNKNRIFLKTTDKRYYNIYLASVLNKFDAREGKKVKYVIANTTAQRKKMLNPYANTPTVVKMNEINPKYENTRKIQRLLTNQNPGFDRGIILT